jgi:hypothetical protein
MVAVEPLIKKSDQVEHIKSFILQAKARSLQVAIVKCDNSMENTSKELLEFYSRQGIELKTTNAYESNQNSSAEATIGIVIARARGMLKDRNMADSYWPFAVRTAAYMMNVVPKENKVPPIEQWTGKRVEKDRLFLFGSLGYIRIPKIKREKLSDRTKIGFLLGYSNNGYLMEQADGIRVWSRDVLFDETKNGYEVVRKTNKDSRLNPKDGDGEPTRVVEVYSSDSEEEK